MFRKVFFLFIFFILFTKAVVAEEGEVLIIHQIRGKECCQAGNLNLIDKVGLEENFKDLSFAWALRFDAIKDQNFLEKIKNLKGELGILLEVTPNLALESGVLYKGKKDGSDWYLAKNAFLVGYSQEERKKIIDKLFDLFKEKFGNYPFFTVSWMIDSWSLSYISQRYNIKVHQLTREQYETDSYTLYGGIFNSAYYPSKDHPLLPGFGKEKLDLIIVRQTLSDFLNNYGFPKAYYTSQPNDYLNNPEKTDFSYFESLIKDFLDQETKTKLAVLGFENSFSWEKYGPEYIKQLNKISGLEKEAKLKVKKLQDYFWEFKKDHLENPVFYFVKDFEFGKEKGVLWYFGKNYRARVIIKDRKIILSDLRNFNKFKDSYGEFPATSDFTYLIVPYLIDGSQQYTLSSLERLKLKEKDLFYGNVLPDFLTNPFGLILGDGDFQLNKDKVSVEIKFKSGSVKFNPESIVIDKNLNPNFNRPYEIAVIKKLFEKEKETVLNFDKHLKFAIRKKKNKLFLGWLSLDEKNFVPIFTIDNEDNYFNLIPVSDYQGGLDFLKPIFQPDQANLPVDPEKSVFYWNNQKAIVSRNPVRLFILPLNKLGRPTTIAAVEVKTSADKNHFKIIYPEDYSYKTAPWFIDIFSDTPIETNISVIVDNVMVVENKPIEFVANCRRYFKVCLTSAPQIIKYIQVLLNEQVLKLKTKLSLLL